jgi:hypothetical protein
MQNQRYKCVIILATRLRAKSYIFEFPEFKKLSPVSESMSVTTNTGRRDVVTWLLSLVDVLGVSSYDRARLLGYLNKCAQKYGRHDSVDWDHSPSNLGSDVIVLSGALLVIDHLASPAFIAQRNQGIRNTDELRELADATAFAEVTRRTSKPVEISIVLWHHSITCEFASYAIYPLKRISKPSRVHRLFREPTL